MEAVQTLLIIIGFVYHCTVPSRAAVFTENLDTCLFMHNDYTIVSITTAQECQTLCENNADFYCCSFELRETSTFSGTSCILSRDSGYTHPNDVTSPCIISSKLYNRENAALDCPPATTVVTTTSFTGTTTFALASEVIMTTNDEGGETIQPATVEGVETTQPATVEGIETTQPTTVEGIETTQQATVQDVETTQPIATERPTLSQLTATDLSMSSQSLNTQVTSTSRTITRIMSTTDTQAQTDDSTKSILTNSPGKTGRPPLPLGNEKGLFKKSATAIDHVDSLYITTHVVIGCTFSFIILGFIIFIVGSDIHKFYDHIVNLNGLLPRLFPSLNSKRVARAPRK